MSVVAEPDFSAEAYREHQMAIPGMDGYTAEKLTASLSGALDYTSSDDLAVLNGMRLGEVVRLSVEAVVTRKGYALASSENDSLGYNVGLKVTSFEVA